MLYIWDIAGVWAHGLLLLSGSGKLRKNEGVAATDYLSLDISKWYFITTSFFSFLEM